MQIFVEAAFKVVFPFYFQVDYNVIKMLEKNTDGKLFLEEYAKNPEDLITDSQRCLIVQVCLTSLIEQTGAYYPPASAKERLAKEIVETRNRVLKSKCRELLNTRIFTTTNPTVISKRFLSSGEMMRGFLNVKESSQQKEHR